MYPIRYPALTQFQLLSLRIYDVTSRHFFDLIFSNFVFVRCLLRSSNSSGNFVDWMTFGKLERKPSNRVSRGNLKYREADTFSHTWNLSFFFQLAFFSIQHHLVKVESMDCFSAKYQKQCIHATRRANFLQELFSWQVMLRISICIRKALFLRPFQHA